MALPAMRLAGLRPEPSSERLALAGPLRRDSGSPQRRARRPPEALRREDGAVLSERPLPILDGVYVSARTTRMLAGLWPVGLRWWTFLLPESLTASRGTWR